MKRRLALLMLGASLLSGCQLRPLYGGGASSPVRTTLGSIEVSPIEGRSGWLVANALRDRLNAVDRSTARYRLDVKLQDEITGIGVRRDDSISRERRSLRARYQLVDLTTGTVVLDATAGSDAGVDVVGSDYATRAAEQSALERLSEIVADQMVARIAEYARRTPAQAPPPATAP